MDPMIYFDSGDRDKNKERNPVGEVLDRLIRVPLGHHYLILYSDIEIMRRVYSNCVKAHIEDQPNSIILLLPYYDNTVKVRQILESNGVNVKQMELERTLIIVDIEKVIENEYYPVTDIERLRALTKQIQSEHTDKTILVIADMSVFHHLRKSSELLEYERALHKDLKVEKWKELCFYNERDFQIMFTEDEANELLEYHKERVITVSQR